MNSDQDVNAIDDQLAIRQVLNLDRCAGSDLDFNGKCDLSDVQFLIGVALGQECAGVPPFEAGTVSSQRLQRRRGGGRRRGVPPFEAWTVSSLIRVGRSDPPRPDRSVRLKAAQREYAPFQIVLRPTGSAASKLSVTASDLLGPSGAVIRASNIELFREDYVYVSHSSPDLRGANRPQGAGWYPDPLTSLGLGGFTALTLQPNENQPLWVDLWVPAGAAPGPYSGQITIRADTGSEIAIPIELQVWGFSLPVAPSLKSMFPLTNFSRDVNADRQMLRHKLMPMLTHPDYAVANMRDYGMSLAALPFWTSANYYNCKLESAPSVTAIKQSISYLPSSLMTYIWVADEIQHCANIFPNVKEWARAIHKTTAKAMVTMPPTRELLDDGGGTGRSAVDIWAVLPVSWEKAAADIRAAQAKGDEVWSYNAMTQDSYSPKWLLDYPLINFRIQPGFISQSLGLTGILYWRADWWQRDPWVDVNNRGVLDENNYPGDGMLIYPNRDSALTGFVSSMRLKQIREGVEDYEYIELLKQHGDTATAMSLTRSVASDWRTWSQDPAVLEQAREMIGAELDRILNDR